MKLEVSIPTKSAKMQRSGRPINFAFVLFFAVGIVRLRGFQFLFFLSTFIVPPAELPFATYHSWAHKVCNQFCHKTSTNSNTLSWSQHWVWNHNSNSNQVNVSYLVNEYLSYDIPVGAVNIDSTWYLNELNLNCLKKWKT